MPTRDAAQIIKDAMTARWNPLAAPTNTDPHYHPLWAPTLHVDDDWRPNDQTEAVLLVADDGGPEIRRGEFPWAEQPQGYSAPYQKRSSHRPLIRMTSFATGRSKAREVVDAAVDWILDGNRPDGIARIDGISLPVITRDPDTGNFLGFVLMPVLVRPA